jgi:LCP family protein required for cell wall assembly
MDPKHKRNRIKSLGQAKPGQDIIVAKNAKKFPSLGMALPSYSSTQAGAAQYKPPAPKKVGRLKRIFKGITLKRSVISLVIIVLLVVGFVGGKFVYNAHKLFGGNIFSVLSTSKLKGEDSGRVNILLAGNSSDDPGHNGADLTDSIMLVSIDTKDNKAFLLSIPRDLYVNIPGAGYQKINDAYVVGQNDNFSAPGYPSGGMGLLEQTISRDFEVPIDYYDLINYQAIKSAVNAVGGITINIQSSDPRGLYDPSKDYSTDGPLVDLTNGVHTLNGEQALDLARARGDAYGSYGFAASDFDRTQHQRQMLVALKSKAVTAGVLANPAKLTELMDAIGNNMTTDLKLPEVHRLYDITKKINGNNIQSLGLNSANGKDLLMNYTGYDGESALAPALGLNNYSAIQEFIKQQTSNNPIVQEGASIVVLNGTSTDGLASDYEHKLTADGFNVQSIGDAQTSDQTTTSIINTVGTGEPATSAALVKLFGNNLTTVNPYVDTYNADFIIVLGQDQVAGDSSTSSNSNQ